MLKKFKLLNFKIANSSLLIKSIEKNSLRVITVISQIKKALKIIHKYHISKKQILFIGNPLYINNQLTTMLKKSKHLFVPKSAWVAGHIANRFTRSSSISHTGNVTKLFSIRKLKKKSSLVVIIDPVKDNIALKEHNCAKIPVIALNSKADMLNEMSTFKVTAKVTPLKSDLNLFLFYSLLISVLKKTQIKKYKRYAKQIKKFRLNLKSLIKKKFRQQNFKFKKNNHFSSKNTQQSNPLYNQKIKPTKIFNAKTFRGKKE